MKDKTIRLDGIRKENVKGEILKNDLYAEYQKAEMIRSEVNKEMNKTEGRKSIKAGLLTSFKD
jgi:hypothetical protein